MLSYVHGLSFKNGTCQRVYLLKWSLTNFVSRLLNYLDKVARRHEQNKSWQTNKPIVKFKY